MTFEAPNAAPVLMTRFARNTMPDAKAARRQHRRHRRPARQPLASAVPGRLALNPPASTVQVRQLAEYAPAFVRV
jgi:hypothetical protein